MRFPGSGGIDEPVRGRQRRAGGRLALVAAAVVLLFGGSTLISWYVEALWFQSLGFGQVFWTTITVKTALFWAAAAVTFAILFGAFRLLRPRRLAGQTLYVNGQAVTFSLEPIVTGATWAVPILVALVSASGLMQNWETFALYLNAPAPAGAFATGDPIFGRPIPFYLLTLPALHLVANWLTTVALVIFIAALAAFVVSGEAGRHLFGSPSGQGRKGFRGVSFSLALVLLVLAGRVYLSRFDRLLQDQTVFSGVGYTDAHVIIPGLIGVSAALALGALVAIYNGIGPRRLVGLLVALAPAVLVFVGLTVASWYVAAFVVKPNQLVRERPFITHNIAFTRQAFDLARIEERDFPAEGGIEAVDLDNNAPTIDNIRLWDWQPLQDTLRQIQEIRTYYDFPDIDLDRYRVGGELRQMMVAAREINVTKLPESSRNWINEKLIYTHGYGVTMNTVNEFTAEGLPQLVLSNMPVQSSMPDVRLTRPEIYFGELTNNDVYVRTRQQEFNYPQGESNDFTTYEGTGGIPVGSLGRRLLIAADRGDLSKLPFSDDITPDSRLLMRRNIRDRVRAIAPFLTYDADPYIVVGDDGRLYWLMDGFTSSALFPYARHYRVGTESINYLRNSVKVVIDAYNGSVVFYAFDREDPILAAYRGLFPSMFTDAAQMPAHLRAHIRYPELLLELQAAAFSLYHMRDPDVFYNREDLWSVASEVSLSENREQTTRPIDPNYVLMRLPGEDSLEFVGILPFTPAKRNNLIGWIAGRSDGEHYGKVRVFNFPENRLVDGPLQVEARIDQNAALSEQLTLWNQQGSHVRRGNLLVIPVGRALLYAKPIYLQAERSPMPQLRLVVLALQDRLGYGPTFEAAMTALFGEQGSARSRAGRGIGEAPGAQPAAPPAGAAAGAAPGAEAMPPATRALIEQAARELADYQRLTAEGRLGEAGQRLESLKKVLEQLNKGVQQR